MDLSTFPEVARGASQGGGTNNNNYNPVNHHNHIHNNTDSSNESIVPPPPSAAASAAVYYQQQQQLENIMYNNSTSIPLLPGGPGHLNPAFLPQGASMPLLYNHNKSMDSAAAGYLHQQNNMNDYGSQLHETTYGRGPPPSQFNLRFNNNNNNGINNNNNYPPLFKPSTGFASLYHNNNNQLGPQSQSVGGLKNSAHHSQYLYMQQQQQHYSQQQLQLQQQQLLQQQPGMTPTLNQLLQAPSLSTTTTTTKQPNNRESDRGTILPPSFQPNAHLFAQQSLVLKIPESGGPSPLQFPYDSAPTTNKIPGNFTVNENSFSYPGVGMKVPPTVLPPHMFNQPTKHRHAFPYNNIRQNLFPDSPASSLFTNNISSMPNHNPNSPLPSTGFVLQQQQQQDKVFHRHQNQTLASGSGGVETTLRHHYQGSLIGDQTGSNFINSSLTSSSSTATTGQQTLQQHYSHLYENVVNSSPTYPTAPNSSNRQYNAFPLLPTSRDLQNARLPHPQFVKSAATTPPLPPSSFNSFQSSKASPSSSDHHHHPYQQHQKEEEGGVPSIIPMIDISNTTTEVEITCLINNDSEASQDPNLPSSALGGVGRKGRYIKRDGTLSKYPKKKKKTDAEEGGTPINPPTPMVMDQATYRNIDESIDCILARHNCNTHKSQLENDCASSDMIIHERASSLVETTMITSPSGLPPVPITTVHLNSDNSIIINNNTTNNSISESADSQTYNNKSSLTTTKPHESGDSPRINSNESSLLNQPESLLTYQNVDHPTITTSNSLSIDSIPLNFSSEDNIPPISHDSISHKDNENFLKSEISTVADSDQSNILTGVTTPSGGYSHQIFSSMPNTITTLTTYLPEDQTTTSSNLSFFKEETTNMSGGGGSSLNFPAVLYPPTSSSSTAVHPSSHNNTISCQGGSEQDIIVAISPYSNSSNQYKFHPGPPAANLGGSSSTSNGVKLIPPHHASPFAANTTHNLNAISHNSPHLLSPGAGSIQSFSTTTDDNRGSIGNLVSGGSQITARKNEPISKLYEFGNEPDRRLFLDHLLKFNDQNANHLPFVPTVSKAYVDLYKLYHMVKERGGVVLVNQRKLWKEIAVYVLEGQSNPVSASYNLRKQYVKCLLDYECKYDLNGADPAPIIAQLEASTKKKKKKLPDPNLSSDKDNYNNNNLESHQNISSTNSQQQGISSKPPPQLPTSNFPKNPEIRHHQTSQDLIYPLNHHPHHHHPNTALLYHPSPYHPLASSSLSISLNSNSNTASAAGAQSSPAFMNVPPSPRVLPISSSSAVASYQQQQQQQTQLLPPQPYPPSQHSFNSSYHQPPPPPYFNAPKDMMMAARSISPYHQPLAPPPLNYAPPQQQPLNVVPRYSSSMVARPLHQPFMYEDPQQRNYVRNPFSDNDPKLNNLLPKYPPPPNTRMLQQQHSHPFVQQPPPLSPYPQQHQQQNSSYQQQHFVPPLQINPLLHNQDINSNVGGTTSFPQSSSLLLHHKSFINNNETRLPTAACSIPRSHPIRFNHHLDSQSLFSSSTQNTSSYPGIPPTTVVMLPPHYPLTTNALGGAEIDYPLTPRVKSEYDLSSYSTTPTNGMTDPHFTNDVNHPNYGNNKFHMNSMGAYPGGNQQHLSSVFTSDYRDSPNLNPNNNFLHKIIPQSSFRNSINTTSVTTLSTQLNNLSSPFFSGDPSLHPHPSLHSHNLSAIDHYSSSPFNHNNRGTATRLGGFQDILPPPNIAITENSIDPKSLKYPPTNTINLMRTPMIPHGHYQQQQQLVSERTPFSLPGFKGGDLNAHQFVEGTVVKSVKFRKNVIAVANKDQNGAVAFDIIRKLIMVLKSGIFHLYTAALDTLNVLLSDDTKNTQFQLTNLPPDFLDLILQYCEICFATTLFCIKKTPTITNGGIISFEVDRHRNMILEPKLTEEIIKAGIGRVKAAYEEAEQEAEEEKLRAGKRETRTSTKRAHAGSGGGNLVNSKKVKNYAWITRRKKQRVKVISDTTTKKSSFFPSPFHALIYEDKDEAEYIDDDNGLNQLVRLNIMRLDVDLARFRQEDRFDSTRRLEKYEECGDNLPDRAAAGLDIIKNLGGYNSDNTLVPLDERVETNLFPFITQRSYDNVLLGNKMCLGVCNILRNLSFIPTNDTHLAKNERLLNLVADVLLLKHTHSKRDCGIGTETSAPNSLIFGNCSSADPAAPPAEAATALEREVWLAISRDSLVILSNLSSKLDLSVLPDLLISRLLVSLLHTLVCNDHVKLPIAQNIAQSLGSTISSSNQHLPPLHQPPRRYMVLEILSKLTVSETNSDYLVALSDLATLESLIGLLVELLMLNTVGHPEIMVLKELSLILLTNLGGGGVGTDAFEITTLPSHLFAPSAVPINSTPATLGGCTSEGSGRLILDLVSHHARSVPALLQFMEEIEANASRIIHNQGFPALRDNPELMGTSLAMLRRCANLLLSITTKTSNLTLLDKYQGRLLNLVMSQILDQNVANILAQVLYISSVVIPRCCPS